jgi:hypothetical protein
MSTLSREHRRMLENTVAQARVIAEEGAQKVLRDQYAVHHHEPWAHMTADDRKLRNQLRAHGRQLGDRRDPKRETQEIEHLVQACAYEHWHRMLFARFLAENDLLLDAENGVAMTLDDVRELAREQSRDWMDIAAGLAQRMLLAVFRPDDPVLKVQLPPETRQQLEERLASLPSEIFQADDSLGWVYQFWQRDEKERINKLPKVEVGANELPAVTQLFTEDYQVLFLLENTLGAWWAAKRYSAGKDISLPGHRWTYLKLKQDGTPAAGTFDTWPRTARDLRVLDPCMGSGHFLVFALPILARMRMEEEGLSLQGSLSAVLKENLFGLEIDARCSQIAAFNLALTCWRMAGQHFQLPEMNLACSGLGINASDADWIKLAGSDFVANQWMRRLYSLFKDAPTLGSLIDPTKYLAKGEEVGFEHVLPLVEKALQQEQSDDRRELAIAAQGVVMAFRILAGRFTLVATNVPYLVKGKQSSKLRSFCEAYAKDAAADLATIFLERCGHFCESGGTHATVTPQNWLFLKTYSAFRKRLLTKYEVCHVTTVGSGQTALASWDVLRALVLVTSRTLEDYTITGVETDAAREDERANDLRNKVVISSTCRGILQNPNHRLALSATGSGELLAFYADSLQGVSTGDNPRFQLMFWEVTDFDRTWAFQQGPVTNTVEYGGRQKVIRWEDGRGEMAHSEGSAIRGLQALGRRGVAVTQMRSLPATIFCGSFFDTNVAVIVPKADKYFSSIWTYCSSPAFAAAVRTIDKKINVTNATLVQVPFDLSNWQQIAAREYPNGIPRPFSSDPAQWLFDGQPRGAESPLQVAIARLVGYRWPRQSGSEFLDCPSVGNDELQIHSDLDGIVPLHAIAGKASASERLRAMLAEAYGSEWSATKVKELLGAWNSLEDWLRDGFFEEHCRVFQHRPFVWHVWDGRKDGFHALVNYHKLVAPNGEGRQTLEKLNYTYLGRWIERQQDEVKAGKEGADARLTAALHLKAELEKILQGEKPYDIFVRWKPLHEQPIGWEPDINDGVRLNIRPWFTAKPCQPSRRDGCILRVTPKIPYGKDRGKEPHRAKEDFPWFWTWDGTSDDFMGGDKFDGARWNDLHYSLAKKKEAREKQSSAASVSAARGRNR